MSDGLEICNLCKKRDHVEVLSDVTLSVAPGTKLALLGHNGAGKSTLIKLVLGLTRRDSGEIRICGTEPGSAAARAAVTYLPESVVFNAALTGREQLALFARLLGVSGRERDDLLGVVGLSDAADRRINTYSKGMRQRLGLAQAMLGHPKLALLDEPTSGLDPISRHDLYAIIDQMADAGTAVVIASHALTELEARTDRIAILRSGRLVANDTLDGLARRAALPIRLRVRARDGGADRLAADLGGQRINGASVDLVCTPTEKMALLRRVATLGDAVDDIAVTPPGLEDLYRHYSREAQS